ncbi:MAG: carboxypeptidase-like regulatory domain-containing protein [Desulfurococcaceae archaeon]
MKISIEFLALSLFVFIITGGFTILPLLSTSQGTETGVKIVIGPTPIMEGEAKGPEDVTLMNEYLAVAFGISTTPPWGISPGHIIDIAAIGERASDVVAQFSFPLNDWGNWATITYFEIVENTAQRGVIQAVGAWRGLRVNYTYILESGKPYLRVIVNVTNTDVSPYLNLIMGPAITFERGWTFVPDYGTGRITTSPKDRWGITEDWVAGYHEDYGIGLYAPSYTHISLHTFFVDPFYQVSLNPGESKLFESYIFILDKPDICKIMEMVYRIKGGELAQIYGLVKNAKEQPLVGAAVIAYRNERPYCWSIAGINGDYSMPILAPGSYSLRAIAKAHGPSSWFNISVKPDEVVNVDFSDVLLPGRLVLNVYRNDTNSLTDARILITGDLLHLFNI